MATVPDDLCRSVTNLVENAVRFGGYATIRLGLSPEHLTIDVEDDGPGISDARKQDVLEPFVRGDDARNMDGKGSASAFPSPTPSCSRMAGRCHCTTGRRTDSSCAFACRYGKRSSARLPRT
jgi:light-regulated signal transduction histidine kinase (bacteriophytochrome)